MKNENEIIQLGCTFRELLLCCDPIEVAGKAAMHDLETHIDVLEPDKLVSIDFFLKQMAGYENAIAEILSYDSCEKRPMAWKLSYVPADEFADRDWINVNLFNWDYVKPPKNLCGDKWENNHYQTFSATFAEWTEHADREILVTEGVLTYCHSLSDIAAEIMWEATFSGFTGMEVSETGSDVLGECKSMMSEYFKQTK